MTLTARLVFLVLALCCFLVKGLGVPTRRLDFQNFGFACVTAAVLFS